MPETENRLDIPAAAKYTGLKTNELYREVAAGRLPGAIGNTVLFSQADLDTYLKKKTQIFQAVSEEIRTILANLAEETRVNWELAGEVPTAEEIEQGTALLVEALIRHTAEIGSRVLYLNPIPTGSTLSFRSILNKSESFGSPSVDLGNLLCANIFKRAGIPAAPGSAAQGIFKLVDKEKEIQVMVTAVPAQQGVTLRLTLYLPGQNTAEDDFGFTNGQEPIIQAVLQARTGLFLITDPARNYYDRYQELLGPIGRDKGKIVAAIEQEPHFNHAGTVQLRIEPSGDPEKFGEQMRNALALAPDILCLDEIRNPDQVRLALEAVASGLVVICFLPAADNTAAVHWLAAGGTEKHILARDLLAMVSHKTVPQSCPVCRKHREATETEVQQLDLPPHTKVIYNQGCQKCREGAISQLILTELWHRSPELTDLINNIEPDRPEKTRLAGGNLPYSFYHVVRKAVLDGLMAVDEALAQLPRTGKVLMK